MTRWLPIMALSFFLAACAGGDLTEYQVDPATVTPPSAPKWALAAPKEVETAAEATQEVAIYATGPEELLGYLDDLALAEDKTERLEATQNDDPLARAYVQRSALIGFPDVISVRAVDLGTGDAGQRASLTLYSRSVYGYSDLGVNEDRLARWLTALSETAPVVGGREAASAN